MFEALCIATGLAIGLTALIAYLRSRDAFHPAVVMAPMFGYMLSISPLLLNSDGGLEYYFTLDQLAHVQLIHLLGMVAFGLGLLSIRPRRPASGWQGIELTPAMARRLHRAAVAMGVVSLAAYIHMIDNVGGFVEAYGRAKGGGRAASGYIAELVLLSFPAVLFLALARRAAGRVRPRDIALALLIMAPHLIQGTFGGRRGPLFLALTMLFFAWLIARGAVPSFKKIIVGVTAIGLAVIFVWSQRQVVYIGADQSIEVNRVWEKLDSERVDPGDTYVYSAAKILEADYYGEYYWGYRYFVTFVIRPIPRQIWPTKYEDMGASWVLGLDEEMERGLQLQAVGFVTPAGSALPAIADVYLEFSWGMLLFFLILGRVFARVWSLHRQRGGVWSVFHCIMLALSIYLATQSFSAWAHRLLFIGVPTLLMWQYWIAGTVRRPVPAGHRIRPGPMGRNAPARPAGSRGLR